MVGVLALAVFMSSLDLFIVNLAFPYISRQYPGTSLSSLSWVLNAYTIVFAAVLVPAGRWADRIGRRRVFAAGLAGFTAGSVLCGLAPGVDAADRGAGRPGGRGGGDGARVAVAAAGRRPGSGPGEGPGHLVGAGRAGGGARPGDRRQPGPGELAVGVLDQRAGRGGRRGAGRPGGAGEPAIRRRAAGRTCWGLGCWRRPSGWSRTRWWRRPSWGWGSAGFIGLLAASLACGAAMVWRSRRHHSPVLELELLRSRTFSGAFGASILYYAGFGAFVLSSVEFLTGVWHYSAVDAGLAIAPGPLMVLPFARLVAPRLAAFLGGPGRVAVIGCLVNAAAQLLWLAQMQATPDYATHLLPAQLLGGAGVGLSIPSLLGAGSASLTPGRFGTGSGILNTARQVGTVLGVAGLVAILSRASSVDPVAAYRHGAVLIIAFFVAAGAVSAGLLTGRPVVAEGPTVTAERRHWDPLTEAEPVAPLTVAEPVAPLTVAEPATNGWNPQQARSVERE